MWTYSTKFCVLTGASLILAACSGQKGVEQDQAAIEPVEIEIPQAILDAPDSVRYEYEAAVDRMELGEEAAAVRLFENFIEAHPEYPGAYVNLAIIYDGQGRTEEAVLLLNQAIEAAPGSVYALNRLGLIKRRQGDFAEAEASWVQATKVNPRYPYAWYNLGVLYDLYLQNLPAALDSYRKYQGLVDPTDVDPMVARWISDLERRLDQQASAAGEAS